MQQIVKDTDFAKLSAQNQHANCRRRSIESVANRAAVWHRIDYIRRVILSQTAEEAAFCPNRSKRPLAIDPIARPSQGLGQSVSFMTRSVTRVPKNQNVQRSG